MPPTPPAAPAPSPPTGEAPAAPILTKETGPAPLRVVPVRRTSQWAATAVVLLLLAMAVNPVVRDEAFQWGVVAGYFTTPAVLCGLGLTFWLTALVMVAPAGFA